MPHCCSKRRGHESAGIWKLLSGGLNSLLCTDHTPGAPARSPLRALLAGYRPRSRAELKRKCAVRGLRRAPLY